MGNIVNVAFGPKAPNDLSQKLRDLADAADRGEITSLVAAYVVGGDYDLFFAASIQESLVLSSLLHDRSIDKFKS